MISNISPQISSYDTSNATSSNQKSSTQTETIKSILSDYNAESLSEDDAKAIVTALQDAGIEASSELASAMDEAGFDAQEVGTLAGVGPQGGGGMPPPPSTEEVDTLADILAELLESEDEDELTSTSANAYSSSSDSTSFEDVLDYTSRIIQLNDDAKEEVMELFESYKSENTEESSTETNNALKNSLKDILSDSSNYKSVSFYV